MEPAHGAGKPRARPRRLSRGPLARAAPRLCFCYPEKHGVFGSVRWATNSVGHAHYLKQTIAFDLLVAAVLFLECGNSSPIRCVCVGDESWQGLGKREVTATNFVASLFWPPTYTVRRPE